MARRTRVERQQASRRSSPTRASTTRASCASAGPARGISEVTATGRVDGVGFTRRVSYLVRVRLDRRVMDSPHLRAGPIDAHERTDRTRRGPGESRTCARRSRGRARRSRPSVGLERGTAAWQRVASMNHTALRVAASLRPRLAGLVAGCGGSPGEGEGSSGATSSALSSNEEAAYKFFVGKGLKSFQAAGIVGNLQQESSLSPTVAQYGGGPGRGIAQWSAGGRWDSDHDDNVVWYAAEQHESAYSLTLQLEFIWYELTTFSGYGLGSLRASTSVEPFRHDRLPERLRRVRRVRPVDPHRVRRAGPERVRREHRRRRELGRRRRHGRELGLLLGHARQGDARERVRPELLGQRVVPVRRRRVGGPLDRPDGVRRRLPARGGVPGGLLLGHARAEHARQRLRPEQVRRPVVPVQER